MKQQVLVLDMDNTLYDYVAFFGPAFRAMIHVLSYDLKVSEDDLYNDFRKIFKSVGTFDYQFLIAQLPYTKGMSDAELARQIARGRQAFDRAKAKRLRTYGGLAETLHQLHAGGVDLVVLTNAPYYHAYSRLKDIKVADYITGFFAWVGNYPTSGAEAEAFCRAREKIRSRFKISFFLDSDDIKPSRSSYDAVVAHFGGGTAYTAVGDSVRKDLVPAHLSGMRTIWAKYGTKVDDRNLKTLLRVTPWSSQQYREHTEYGSFRPDYVIEKPSDLLDIVPHERTYWEQMGLFDGECEGSDVGGR